MEALYRRGSFGQIYKLENYMPYQFNFNTSKWCSTPSAVEAFYDDSSTVEISYEEAMMEIGSRYK